LGRKSQAEGEEEIVSISVNKAFVISKDKRIMFPHGSLQRK
jgi:hypothetical protein